MDIPNLLHQKQNQPVENPKKDMGRLARTIEKNKKIKQMEREKKLKRIKIGSVALISLSLLIMGFVAVNSFTKWARNNTILIQAPLVIKKQKMVEIISLAELHRREEQARMTDELSKLVMGIILEPAKNSIDNVKESIKGLKVNADEFFDTIWYFESSRGKNNTKGSLADYCQSIGMWNEIGYGGMTGKMCFKDKQEAQLFINYYVYKYGQDKSMSELLCYYNTGKATKTCAYSEGRLGEAN